jgi:hypothetical protein
MEELPNELLLQIFSLLHTPPITCFSSPRVPNRSRDVLVLCRVCRRFKDVARSLIYESVERTGDTNSQAYRALSSTLLENLELCRYIKNLRLKMDDGSEVGDFWAGYNLQVEKGHDEEEDEEHANQHARRIRYQRRHQKTPVGNEGDVDKGVHEMLHDTPDGYEWLGKLISAMDSSQAHARDSDLLERAVFGEDILLTPCVLSACNLERLWIRLPKMQADGNNTSFLFTSLAYSANEGGFERLKVLHLDIYHSDLEWPVRDTLPFFLLPNLTDLTIGNCGESDRGQPWSVGPDSNDSASMGEPWKWPVRTSSITRLSLLSPRFSGSIVARMLLACRAITEFEVVSPQEHQPYDTEFYEDVGMALVEHADTLVSLSLGHALAQVDGSTGHVLDQLLGVFRVGNRLSSLTFLRINPLLLLGCNVPRKWTINTSSDLADALPSTLEHLWLDEPRRPWHLGLSAYLRGVYDAVRSGRLTQLKSIHVHWHQCFPHNWDTVLSHVRGLMYLREDSLWAAPTIDFDVTVRIAYSTSGKPPLSI